MQDKQMEIIVVGAGYAGMMAALRLDGKTKKMPVQVTLVNAVDTFVERPRLHEVATGRFPEAKPLTDMLWNTGIRFRQGVVTALAPQRNQLTLQTPAGAATQINYDYLVYALGSRVDQDSVPGAREHAYTLDPAGSRSAGPLFQQLESLSAGGGSVAVVGSGPTGIEIAAEIADRYPQLHVRLITRGAFGAFVPPRVQAYMRQGLARLNVHIVEQMTVAEVRPGLLVDEQSNEHLFDICIWAGGFRGSPLARGAGIQTNRRDQIMADPALRSLSHPAVFAVGDAVYPVQPAGAPLRMSLFTALTTAAHVADNLTLLAKGKPLRSFGFSTYGQGIALGRCDAVGFNTFPNDRPVGPLVTGRVGLAVRNFFVWLLLVMLEVERRRPGFFFWPGRNRGAKIDRPAPSIPAGEQVPST